MSRTSTSGNNLVTVATYWDPMEAHIARLRLAHEGITAFLEKEFTVQMAWHFTNAIDGVRLNVPARLLEEAQKLLSTKELFSDWQPSKCWEASLNGIPVVTEEEELAVARDLEFREPLSLREELAERALRAAILGLRWEIPFLFACGLLWKFYTTEGECRSAYLRKANWAWGMTALMATVFLFIIFMLWLSVITPFDHQFEPRYEDPLINAARP
jgi:hypothetical protein